VILLVTKKELSKILSNLKGFDNPEISLEQYITPSEIASNFLWLVYMQRDIKGKIIADLGSGTGILGIGALILGAEKVYFVDQSLEALEIAKKNLSSVRIDKNRASFICKNVREFKVKVDTVIQNPPFGVKKLHADRDFLSQAIKLADKIYSFHKIESQTFIERFSEDNNFKSMLLYKIDFPLKWSYKHHSKPVKNIKVGVWKIERKT